MSRLAFFGALALLVFTQPAEAQRNEVADRAAIHALMVEYGTTLDSRDFDGFARLFGDDGVYVAGNGSETRGPAAADLLRTLFEANAQGFRQPNFHLFFNEVVTFEGPDRARANSMSLFMVPGPDGRPVAAMSARYEDELVREDDRWRFARRVVRPITNTPAGN